MSTYFGFFRISCDDDASGSAEACVPLLHTFSTLLSLVHYASESVSYPLSEPIIFFNANAAAAAIGRNVSSPYNDHLSSPANTHPKDDKKVDEKDDEKIVGA